MIDISTRIQSIYNQFFFLQSIFTSISNIISYDKIA